MSPFLLLLALICSSAVAVSAEVQTRTWIAASANASGMFSQLTANGRELVAWTFDAGTPAVRASFGAGTTGPSDVAAFTEWGFSIPSGMFISSVEVSFERKTDRSLAGTERALDYYVALLGHSSGPASASTLSTSDWGLTPSEQNYSGTNQNGVWGVVWTPSLINSNSFGFGIGAQRCAGTCSGVPGTGGSVSALSLIIVRASITVTYASTPISQSTSTSGLSEEVSSSAARPSTTSTALSVEAASSESADSSSTALLIVMIVVGVICAVNAVLIVVGLRRFWRAGSNSPASPEDAETLLIQPTSTPSAAASSRQPRRARHDNASDSPDGKTRAKSSSQHRRPRQHSSSDNDDSSKHNIRRTKSSSKKHRRPRPDSSSDKDKSEANYNTVPTEAIYNTFRGELQEEGQEEEIVYNTFLGELPEEEEKEEEEEEEEEEIIYSTFPKADRD